MIRFLSFYQSHLDGDFVVEDCEDYDEDLEGLVDDYSEDVPDEDDQEDVNIVDKFGFVKKRCTQFT